MPAAPSFDFIPFEKECWRLVEPQHSISTLKLVDTLDEQRLLEEMIEKTKPSVPPECQGLDFLLFTPFRYDAPYPKGSRFRRAGMTAGVFHASEEPETAVAEMAFYRLLFFAESPGTPWPDSITEYSAFSVRVRTGRAIDLTAPPLNRQQKVWRDVQDYGPCQALAEQARAAGCEAIRYESVRDPSRRANVAVLTCKAFRDRAPRKRQSWRLRLSANGVQALCEAPRLRLEFDRAAFSADPRIAALRWDR